MTRLSGAAAIGAVLALALWMACAFRPPIALDDAAITFRYAERAASGRGLTYNDDERVLGTSSPLYALTLAGISRTSGLDIEHAAAWLATLAYAASAVLAMLIAARVGSPAAAAVTAVIFLGDAFLRYHMLSGMEIGLAVTLGLAAVLAVAWERDVLAGALLGLALWNKLDAAALAAVVLVLTLTSHRRSAAVIAVCAAAIVVPWFLWAQHEYGSIVPHSVAAKIAGGEGRPFDPWWVARFLSHRHRTGALILAVVATAAAVIGSRTRSRIAVWSLAGWAGIHALAYSVVDLGAPYEWYLAVPLAPIAVLAGVAVDGGAQAMSASRRRWVLMAAAWGVAAWVIAGGLYETRAEWHTRSTLHSWEAFDADRRMAGAFLRAYARPDEILATAYGWPAYESRLPVNDGAGLNTIRSREPVSYQIEHGNPFQRGSVPPTAPDGMEPLATFNLASGRFPGTSWFVVFGRPESAIARSTIRQLRYRLFELERTAPAAGAASALSIPSEIDLKLRAPFDVAFRIPEVPGRIRLVFTPEAAPDRAAAAIHFDGQRVWEASGAEASADRVALELNPGAGARRELRFTAIDAGALWLRDVEVQIGDNGVDARRLLEARLAAAYADRR